MINNIYELENGRQYVVIAEENIDNKKYVLVMECNYEKDEINEDLLLKLVTINGDGIVFKNVDEETANRVLPILLTKYQKQVERFLSIFFLICVKFFPFVC